MNPEELWQTTLNPCKRTLLKVQYSKGTKEKSKDDQKYKIFNAIELRQEKNL